MLFNASTLSGLVEGRVSFTYRRWTVVRPKVGSRFTTRAGVVEVTSIVPVSEQELTDADAAAAGYPSRGALLKANQPKPAAGSADTAPLYRIGIRLAGPDPRVALREESTLSDDQYATLDARLTRMDRAAEQPWTRQVLRQIRSRPAVVSTDLAAELGQDRPSYKIRVRRLKALGLTTSLEVGYRLSPRGSSYLDRFQEQES